MTHDTNNIINIQEYLDSNRASRPEFSAIEIAKAMQIADEQHYKERSYKDILCEVAQTEAQKLHRAGKQISIDDFFDAVSAIRRLVDLVKTASIVCNPKDAENNHISLGLLTDYINKPEADEEWLKMILEPRKDVLTKMMSETEAIIENDVDLDFEYSEEERREDMLCDEAVEEWKALHGEPWSQDNTI